MREPSLIAQLDMRVEEASKIIPAETRKKRERTKRRAVRLAGFEKMRLIPRARV